MFDVIKSENGLNWIKPYKITMEDLIEIEELYGHAVYFKECMLGELNAMELHIICDNDTHCMPIDGLIYFLVSPIESILI